MLRDKFNTDPIDTIHRPPRQEPDLARRLTLLLLPGPPMVTDDIIWLLLLRSTQSRQAAKRAKLHGKTGLAHLITHMNRRIMALVGR